ncbi:MAG: phosphate ABC transporter permease subunit PstC [Bdellovibrionaceae bacterium]|nr:phosphate ABC transporter permease subunit PstC [Pseudobdellovibrionaceae bacterium]MDW8190292.1 phosphate ABC transporter permease subunit PstC [Pseudobdellovibrionaceae bacterium]
MRQSSNKLSISHQLKRLIEHRKITERWVTTLFFGVSLTSIITIFLIAFTLFAESIPFFEQVSFFEFLTAPEWTPLFENPKFGIMPLVAATLTTTWIAIVVATLLGVTLACFLSEFASPWLRETIKPILEILAGIPTIVYGYFALIYVTPFLQTFIKDLPGFNMLSAGLVMGLMITPYLTSLIEDALSSVGPELREGSLALGASRVETIFLVLLPQIKSSLIASLILAVSRALGETMIVTIAAGSMAALSWNPLTPGQTLTAFIAQISLGDSPHGSLSYQAMYAVGFVLFVMTLILNVISFFIRNRKV